MRSSHIATKAAIATAMDDHGHAKAVSTCPPGPQWMNAYCAAGPALHWQIGQPDGGTQGVRKNNRRMAAAIHGLNDHCDGCC